MTDPVGDRMRQAFQALLRGDTAERDRLCAEAREIIDRQSSAAGFVRQTLQRPIKLVEQPDGSFAAEKQTH